MVPPCGSSRVTGIVLLEVAGYADVLHVRKDEGGSIQSQGRPQVIESAYFATSISVIVIAPSRW